MFWKLCPFHFGSQCVTLKNDNEPVVLSHIDEFGVYDVTVVDAKDKYNGSKSSFIVSANGVNGGSIFRAVCTKGLHNESVALSWDAGQQHPRLRYHDVPSGEGSPISQEFKVTFRKTA